MRRLLGAVWITMAALLLFSGVTVAQDDDGDDDDSFLFRVNGSTSIAAGETVDAALIINGDVTVDGTVTESLVVVNGTATVNGTVGSDITVVSGDLVLNASAQVEDVMLIRSSITQDPAAVVSGDIEERDDGDFSLGRGFAVFSILAWGGLVILGIVAAIVFAWLGRAQLFGSVETLRSQFAMSLVTAIVLFIALPIVAFLTIFTLVGAPLGLTTLMVVLPALFLLGTIVFGSWIASYIIKSSSTAAAIGTAVLGVVILALVSLIPFVGWLVMILGGMMGAGALVYRSVRRSGTASPPQTS